jgi:hypothetical protein
MKKEKRVKIHSATMFIPLSAKAGSFKMGSQKSRIGGSEFRVSTIIDEDEDEKIAMDLEKIQ